MDPQVLEMLTFERRKRGACESIQASAVPLGKGDFKHLNLKDFIGFCAADA
jgi:hypothetical protein